MIEIKFYYQKLNGNWNIATKTFNDVYKAIRFIYKCNRSPKLLFSGDVTCDDPYDLELIHRRFK